MKTTRMTGITVRFEPPVMQQMQAEASKQNSCVAHIVRQSVSDYLNEKK